MKKKTLRIISAVTGAAISLSALALFAGCTSDSPEVRITYLFNGNEYAVDYTLSRLDAPKTVQHFIELADAGYYDYDEETGTGFVVHNFDETDGIYTGGYTLNGEELEEVDYTSRVKELVGSNFTHSVWKDSARTVPTYTIYGEFENNGYRTADDSRVNRHTQGALVMYYTDKANSWVDVTVERADGGKQTEGEPYDTRGYVYNSATALFYTYLGSSLNSSSEAKYCVFGMAKDYETQLTNGLLKAIEEYTEQFSEDEDYTFTKEFEDFRINRYDTFDSVKNAGSTATYYAPVGDAAIILKSVKVTKY